MIARYFRPLEIPPTVFFSLYSYLWTSPTKRRKQEELPFPPRPIHPAEPPTRISPSPAQSITGVGFPFLLPLSLSGKPAARLYGVSESWSNSHPSGCSPRCNAHAILPRHKVQCLTYRWLLFLSTHPHSPPASASPAITCFLNRSHVISRCSFWRRLTPHSCQAEVGGLEGRVRSSSREVFVRGLSLVPCLSVRRPSSTPFLARTHGMASPSTIVLVPCTFLHGTGVLWGILLF